jgi:hypothetical protein
MLSLSSSIDLFREGLVPRLLLYIEESLCISEWQDWYRVSETHLQRIGAQQAISKSGGLFKVLFYPPGIPTTVIYRLIRC